MLIFAVCGCPEQDINELQQWSDMGLSELATPKRPISAILSFVATVVQDIPQVVWTLASVAIIWVEMQKLGRIQFREFCRDLVYFLVETDFFIALAKPGVVDQRCVYNKRVEVALPKFRRVEKAIHETPVCVQFAA